MSDPIVPARIIPPDKPMPAESEPAAPAAPPAADVPRPRRRRAAPPRAESPPPQPEPAAEPVIHVTITAPEPEDAQEPEPRRDWKWLKAWLAPRHTLIAAAAVLVPLPVPGHRSLATGWAHALTLCRDDPDGGIGAAYLLAGAAFTVPVVLELVAHRRRRTTSWWVRPLLLVAVIGGTGAVRLFDPITFLTGAR